MEQVTEKAAKYAEEKANDFITSMVAKAYEDGYRDGYKDREDEIPVDLRDNKTEYVDLGLPSGTLWAKKYDKRDGNTVFLPYCQASELNIPTQEQLDELFSLCEWEYGFYENWEPYGNNGGSIQCFYLKDAKCIGPNGNTITFIPMGRRTSGSDENVDGKNVNKVRFWINNNDDNSKKSSALIHNPEKTHTVKQRTDELFSGYLLPIRLVKTK